ncbi:MAG: GNAT family N-acetyltransferase [Actinomycetota bacterium]|nr:GNAT family N-acetyltransferase [Actinomycetota bacterium]
MTPRIRPYKNVDESGWLRCRVLSFLSTPYFDDVKASKDRYSRPAIELVAEAGDDIVGLLDLELETAPGDLCWKSGSLGGVMWNIAVHPDHQRERIATRLLEEAVALSRKKGIQRIEAWTRNHPPTQAWYEKNGFRKIHTYLHVFVDDDEASEEFPASTRSDLRVVNAFAHYTGDAPEEIRSRFRRVHDCFLYELLMD